MLVWSVLAGEPAGSVAGQPGSRAARDLVNGELSVRCRTRPVSASLQSIRASFLSRYPPSALARAAAATAVARQRLDSRAGRWRDCGLLRMCVLGCTAARMLPPARLGTSDLSEPPMGSVQGNEREPATSNSSEPSSPDKGRAFSVAAGRPRWRLWLAACWPRSGLYFRR